MHARALRRLLLALLALSILGLLASHLWPDSTLVIDAHAPFDIEAVDDRASAGGHSVATVVRDDREIRLDCDVQPGAAPAGCELVVHLRVAPLGVDLSRYDTMRLWLGSTGPEREPRVRLVLRNFNPAYARVGDPRSQKVNQLQFAPGQYPPGTAVELRRFSVLASWVLEHPLPLALTGVELDNVTTLGIATPPNAQPGLHTIRLERIELRGRPWSLQTAYLALLLLWIVAVGLYLLVDAEFGRRALRVSAASQQSLQRLNEALLLETRSLADLARTDPLTGLLNRRGLADELSVLVRADGDAVFPLALVFIDIDHFRVVNAEHGHEVGDQVIEGLADLVRAAVQRDDLFARWGGEEFLLVFRRTSGRDACAIAERLRERIADAAWPVSLRLTCSFGVTEWRRGEDLNEGVRRADEAMYRAKQQGRDRVELQLEDSPAPPSAPA